MFFAETTNHCFNANTPNDHTQLIANVSSDTNAYTGFTTRTVQARQVKIFTVAEATRRPGLPPFPLLYVMLRGSVSRVLLWMLRTAVCLTARETAEYMTFSSSYSATALSVWPWLPLQLKPIPLYPMLSLSIVSHQATLNRLPHRLSTWVWVVLYLYTLLRTIFMFQLVWL